MFGLLVNPSLLISFYPTIVKAQEILGTGAGTVTIIANTDPGTKAAEAAAGTTAVKTVATFTDRLWQSAKIVIGQRLKKMILDQIVDSAVKWIKAGGFEGKGGPIVEDWGAFFEDIGNQALGELAESTFPFLCGSFQMNLALSLPPEPKTIAERTTCTLDDVVDNVDKIFEDYRKESKGRWITYNTLWEPQNNYFGSTILAKETLESRELDLLNQKNIEATVNLGFKSQKKCTIDKQTGKEKCEIITPGNVVGKQIQETIMPNDNAIISANDLATYIGALADAVLYRYTIMANEGLRGLLGYTEKEISDGSLGFWEGQYNEQFSQIENITFQNNRALFIDEINSMLTIKRSTLGYLNQSITTENNLNTSLDILLTCAEPINGWTQEESELVVANAPIIINDITYIIPELETRELQVQDEIDELMAIIDEFNGLTSVDSQSMLITYSYLVSQGYLDFSAATITLSDTQTELAGFQEYSKEILESPTPDGYLTLIPYCIDNQISLETP